MKLSLRLRCDAGAADFAPLGKITQEHYDALFDPRSGLPKAALVRDRLQMALALARRSRKLVGLFHVGIHAPATSDSDIDTMITSVARGFAAAVRPGDTVGRLGDAELVVVCQDIPYEEDAAPLVERLLATLDRSLDGRGCLPEVEIGVALGRGDADPRDLLVEAQLARVSTHSAHSA